MPEIIQFYTRAVGMIIFAFVFFVVTEVEGQNAGILSPYKGPVVN